MVPRDTWMDLSLTRRQLVMRSLAFGVSVPAVAGLLVACAEDDDAEEVDATDDEPVDEPDDPDDTETDPVDEPDDPDDTETDPVDEPDDPDDTDDEPVEDPDDDDPPDDDAPDNGQYGGTLEVALVDELPTFDPHQSTQTIIGFVMWHVYEHLYTYDDEFNIIPELAEANETSDDGLVNTITLRQGIRFHNGEEMTAEDVIANIERWGGLAGRGQVLFENVEGLTQVDDHTIEIEMSQPVGVIWAMLARHNNGCVIYPLDVIDAAGSDAVQEYIGTGPYEFVEHIADEYIHLTRFEDYELLEDEPNGWGGAKHAYVDDIYFRPSPDEASRAAGLQAGDFHVLQSTSMDNFALFDDDPNLVAELIPPTLVLTIQLNTQDGPMSNPVLRQAVQAALDHEPILIAAYGDAESIRTEASWMPEELVDWYTDACGEYYSPNDPDRAAELLEEAGYDGEPLRFVTSEHENFHINTALTAQQQLEDAGFNIDVQVFDWPTLSGEVREDMSQWELLTSGTSVRPDPSMFSPMDPGWGGRWDTDQKRELLNSLMSEPDLDTQIGIWEQIQCLAYEEDVPFINLGKSYALAAYSTQLQDWRPDLSMVEPFFWNIWLEE